MRARLQSFMHAEVAPVLDGLPRASTFVLLLGTALLINKRYLADEAYGGAAVTRWQALAAWLAGTAVFVASRRSAKLPHWLPGLLGAGAITLVMAPAGFIFGNWQWSLAQHAEPLGMMLLVWLVVAPAAVRSPGEQPRPGAGMLAALAGLATCAACLAGLGPLRQVLTDARIDKLNWCLLTAGWLLLGNRSLTLPVLGGSWRDDGGGLGRWRFWLPWTLGLLAAMVLLIVFVVGRDRNFLAYYPMYRRDWGGYDPHRDGWGFYLAYTLAFGAYFLAWEQFFRGWMLFRLERELGPLALVVQAVPFVIMHLGKPGLELHSSLVAGLVLGWLALRGRSFWPCFLLHWGAAATMDAWALFRGLA